MKITPLKELEIVKEMVKSAAEFDMKTLTGIQTEILDIKDEDKKADLLSTCEQIFELVDMAKL